MYTTQGYMTPADMDEIRRDMDLDLCGCCESGPAVRPDESGCQACGHEDEGHIDPWQ